MTVSVTKFRPQSRIHGGKNGLATTGNSKSHVKIVGTELQDGQCVKVFMPRNATTPLWTGDTYDTKDGTQCKVRLVRATSADAVQRGVGAGISEVGVTVGDSPVTPFNVLIGPPLNGSYAISCEANSPNKWLDHSSTTSLQMIGGNTGPTWIFTLLENEQGNCYRMQHSIDGTTYYLQWTNDGNQGTNLGFVQNVEDSSTTWILDGDNIRAFASPSIPQQPTCPFLSCDVQNNGAVGMWGIPGTAGGSTWALGTFGDPPPKV